MILSVKAGITLWLYGISRVLWRFNAAESSSLFFVDCKKEEEEGRVNNVPIEFYLCRNVVVLYITISQARSRARKNFPAVEK